jgi:serine/threonine protein kinase
MSHRILEALSYLHAGHGAHLDIKSENIFLTPGDPPVAWLGDFGIACERKSPAEKFTHLAVSAGWQAPELLVAHPVYDEAVDVWAFGILLATMVTGAAPFPMTDDDLDSGRHAHAVRASEPFAGVSQEWKARWSPRFWNLLGRLLEKNPRNRITAAEALAHDFYRVAPPSQLAATTKMVGAIARAQLEAREFDTGQPGE